MEIRLIFLLFMLFIHCGLLEPLIYSARLVHRFSDEAQAHHGLRVLQNEPQLTRRRSLEYHRRLLSSDLQRQTLKLNPQFQFLYPSEGSATLAYGNEFGWLHYMWIDIGTPSVAFLVALDSGSDLFWVPCDCIQCAPLSSNHYSSLDKDLSEYNPSASSTSKPLSCSHQLCEMGTHCSNPKEQCPYTINYNTDDTSTSGFLVEDILHLVSGHTDKANKSLRAPVIIGCGSKQSGGYLDGVAPDGLLGLGLGELSVPSLLAKAGYIQNSFSICFNDDDNGRLFFGDQGIASQQTTPFLPLDGKNLTYIVGVDTFYVGSSSLENSEIQMLVDSGTSFTFLPDFLYEKVVIEFDRQVNASKTTFEGYPWKYCYKSSSGELPKFPSVTLKFGTNSSFIVNRPVFVIYGTQGASGFCLTIQPTDEKIGTIGQNFMSGYQMVFDRVSMNLGWFHSKCQDLNSEDRMPLTPSSDNNSSSSLPTTAQQNHYNGQAVAPAVAGRTPNNSAVHKSSCLPMLLSTLLVLTNLLSFCW